LNAVLRQVNAVKEDFAELSRIIFHNASLTDRLETTGILKEQTARDHGVMGVVGRASSIDRDIRRDRPFAAYDHLTFKVPVYRYGDVRARLRVRIDEIHETISLIRQSLEGLPDGPISTAFTSSPPPGDWALSAVEGWRGEILYFVMAGEEGKLHRCKVRDPSFVIWPAIQFAVLGNIIPDFPLINKSFNLSYAGNDL
jgi:Ni,Fe-hydrogenase III large subunit